MKITKIFALIVAMFAMTSCLKHGDKVSTHTLPGYLNYAFDGRDNPIAMAKGVGYTIDYNYDTNQATVTIENFVTPTGQKYTALTFANLPWKYNSNGWMVIEAQSVTPTSTILNAPTFDHFQLLVYPRYVNNLYFPFTKISYQVDGSRIYSLPNALINGGTTVVTAPDGSKYTQPESEPAFYIISFEPDKDMATISIQGAKFASNMPSMNIKFKDIPYYVTAQGKYSLQTDKVATPLVVGNTGQETPYDKLSITNLYCTTDAANNMQLNFTCTMKQDIPGTGTVEIPYQVAVITNGPEIN